MMMGGSGGGRAMGMLSNLMGGGNQSGIARTIAGGLNYNDAWSKNTAVSGSYFYNNMNILNGNNRFRETFVQNDSSLFSTSKNISRSLNENHRFNWLSQRTSIEIFNDTFHWKALSPEFYFFSNYLLVACITCSLHQLFIYYKSVGGIAIGQIFSRNQINGE